MAAPEVSLVVNQGRVRTAFENLLKRVELWHDMQDQLHDEQPLTRYISGKFDVRDRVGGLGWEMMIKRSSAAGLRMYPSSDTTAPKATKGLEQALQGGWFTIDGIARWTTRDMQPPRGELSGWASAQMDQMKDLRRMLSDGIQESYVSNGDAVMGWANKAAGSTAVFSIRKDKIWNFIQREGTLWDIDDDADGTMEILGTELQSVDWTVDPPTVTFADASAAAAITDYTIKIRPHGSSSTGPQGIPLVFDTSASYLNVSSRTTTGKWFAGRTWSTPYTISGGGGLGKHYFTRVLRPPIRSIRQFGGHGDVCVMCPDDLHDALMEVFFDTLRGDIKGSVYTLGPQAKDSVRVGNYEGGEIVVFPNPRVPSGEIWILHAPDFEIVRRFDEFYWEMSAAGTILWDSYADVATAAFDTAAADIRAESAKFAWAKGDITTICPYPWRQHRITNQTAFGALLPEA